MQLAPEIRDEIAHPCIEGEEASFGIVSFARFVVGSADDQNVVLAVGLQPHVVIGLERIPIKTVGQRTFGQGERHRVGAVGCLLGMNGIFVVDRRIGRHHCMPSIHRVLASSHYHAVFIFFNMIDRCLGVEATATLANGRRKSG